MFPTLGYPTPEWAPHNSGSYTHATSFEESSISEKSDDHVGRQMSIETDGQGRRRETAGRKELPDMKRTAGHVGLPVTKNCRTRRTAGHEENNCL